ncbi:unnamed protein product [Notodromas monacha]|uniref:Protein kinase domain-containing protein n=1 Tax=Notodromas monacha TaxID=399045 RepID=A0A7R9BEI0_9CRUS|nr:unnamed protein product [Notodromas monacha]CAG0913316.1 unnamed protein product [Notodromas monacha]
MKRVITRNDRSTRVRNVYTATLYVHKANVTSRIRMRLAVLLWLYVSVLYSLLVFLASGHEVSTESEIALLPRITSQPGLSGQESVSPEPRHRSEKVAQRRERSRRQQFAIPRFNSERSPATTPLLGRHNSLRRSSSNRSSENDLFHPGHRYYVSSPECGIEFCGVREVPRESISFLERLGGGDFATIFLCKIPRRSSGSAEDYNLPGECFESTELVVLKTLTRCNASDSESATLAQEVALLSELRDPNIANIIGISRTTEDPLSRYSVIVEYLPFGDLHSFLRTKNRSAPGTEFLPDQDFDTFLSSVNKLTCGDLLFMATQIASGMMYLESLTCVHRDLAARNILVGSGLHVKISDFAMYQEKFSRDYYMFENTKLPIRWMAWEGISTGKWSGGSDVWAFSVTLWEIFTFAQGQPYDGLSDDEVIRNAIVHEFSPQVSWISCTTPPFRYCCKEFFLSLRGFLLTCWLIIFELIIVKVMHHFHDRSHLE